MVNQLDDNKMVNSGAEIFKLTFQDLVNLERMAEKSAENILNAIESSTVSYTHLTLPTNREV